MAIEKIAIDIKSNAKEVEKELAKINSEIKKLEKEKITIQMNVDQLEAAEKKVDKLNKKISELSIHKAAIEIDIGEIDGASKAIEKLQQNIQQLSSIQVQTDISIRLSDIDLNMENIGSELQDQGLKLIKNITAVIEEGAAALQTASDKLPADMDSIIPKLTAMGAAIVGMGVLVGAAGAAATEFPKEAKTGFKMIREIGKLLIESAEVMEEISGKLPSDFGDFGSKLDGMNLAIAAMSVLVAAAGAAATEFPKEAKTGFKMIREIGKVLVESAEVVEEISGKLPSDFGDVASKMASMGVAIGGMGLLVGIAGKAATEFPKEAKAGFKLIREIGKVLLESAEVVEEISGKLPSDFGDMASKMASMGIAIGGMGLLVGIAGKAATEFPKEAKAGFKTISEISTILIESAEALGEVAVKVPSDFGDMASRLGSMGLAIVGMGALVGIAGKAAMEFPEEAKEGFSKILDINILLQETAETMGQIAQKIPSDLGEMSSRLASMGIAIVGMGALVGIAGKLATEFPEEAKAGLDMIIDISILLQEAADTMGQIAEKIPSDLGAMSSRLASMGIAIVGMGALIGIAGKLATEFPEEAKAGLDMIIDISILLQEAAETMGQIAEKIPSDLGAMSSRLASMGIAILGMGVLIGIAGKLATEFPEEAKAGLDMIIDISILLQEAADTMGQIAEKIPSDLGAMVSKFASMGIAIVGMGALVVIAGAVNKKFSKETKAGLAMISEVNVLLLDAANALGQINKKVPSDLGSMVSKLAGMGIAIGGMSALVLVVGKFAESNPLAAIAGLMVIGKVIDLLMESAEAMKQIDKKVPGNIEKVAEKLGSIGIAIGGMSALVGVVGALVASGVGALIAGAGLATVYLVAEELIHISEAIKEMDQNVPEDMTGVKEKIEGIAEAVGYFTAADLGGVLDLLKNAVGALNTAVAAEGIKKLVDVGLELQKFESITIPDDIEAKINAIQDVFDYLKKGVGLIGELNQFFNGGGIDTKIGDKASQAIGNLVEVADASEKLAEVNLDNLGDIEGKITKLQGMFEIFTKTKGWISDVKRAFEGGDIDTDIAKDAKNYVKSIADIATSFVELEKTEFNIGTVKSKIEGIQGVFDLFLEKGNLIDRFKSLFTGEDSIDTGLVKKAKEYVTNLAAIAGELVKIQDAELIFGDVQEKLQKIQDIVKEFAKIDLKMDLDSDSLNDAVMKAGLVNDLITHLETALKFTFDVGALNQFKQTMKNVTEAIKEILLADFVPKEENGQEMKIPSWTAMKKKVTEAIEKLKELNLLGTQISEALEFKFSKESLASFKTTMEIMKDAIREVLTTDFDPEDGEGNKIDFESWEEIKQPILDAINKLTELNNLGKQLEENLKFEFDIAKFERILGQLKSAYQMITNFDLNMDVRGTENGADSTEWEAPFLGNNLLPEANIQSFNTTSNSGTGFEEKVTNTIKKIGKIVELQTELKKITDNPIDSEAFGTALSNLHQCLVSIQTFIAKAPEIGELDLISEGINKIKLMVEAINGLLEAFKTVGTNYATALLQGFDSVGLPIVLTVKLLALALFIRTGTIPAQFYEVGKVYGNKLKDGFSNALNGISSKLNEVASTLQTSIASSAAITNFRSIGTSLGNALVAGFKSAVEGLYVKVSASNGTGSDIINSIGLATGGLVPSYLASGGLASIFKKKGTDTVPAMLTPGEFVQRKAAVNTFGIDFMKRVNNLDIRGAFNALTGRFNTQGMMAPAVSSIVNNINHTTNNANRVTQNIMGGNADYIMRRAGRYLR